MDHLGTLIFFCGKMGAGKSTSAKRIAVERDAVLISEDEWLSAHYPDQIHTFDDYLTYSATIKPFVKLLVQRILHTGTDVVMDFLGNTPAQRAWYKQLCAEVGCDHQLWYLGVSDKKCLLHIAHRRTEQPHRAQFDTEEVFRHVNQYFQPPSSGEGLNILLVS
ncbi:AAA family ATPase [Vibrio sp.]|uniref:AAA family ATPase n=1 Tax=Vibrio sp. TaxID=678 RepID=UPI003D0C92EC